MRVHKKSSVFAASTLAVAVFAVSVCTQAIAQLNPAILDRLDSDTAGFVTVERPKEILRVLEETLGEEFQDLAVYCTQQPHPLLDRAQVEKIQEQVAEATQLIGKIKKIEVIVHRWETDPFPDLSVLIYVQTDSIVKLESISSTVSEIIRTLPLNPLLASETSNENQPSEAAPRNGNDPPGDTAEVNRPPSMAEAFLDRWRSHTFVDGGQRCLIVSNSNDLIDGDGLVQPKEKKLLKASRRFQSFEVFDEKPQPFSLLPLVTAYLEPEKVRPLIDAKSGDSVWKAMGISELPMSATKIYLAKDQAIVVDTKITMTFPPSGKSAQWLSYRPFDRHANIDDPNIATRMSYGIDSKMAIENTIKYYDNAYGKDSFKQPFEQRYGRSDPEFLEQFCRKTALKELLVVIPSSTDDLRQRRFVPIERIDDRAAMDLVIDQTVKKQNSWGSERGLILEKIQHGDDYIWMFRDTKEFRESQSATVHAVVGDWYIQGPPSIVHDYFQSLQKVETQQSQWIDSLEPNCREFAKDFHPTVVTKYDQNYWRCEARDHLVGRVIQRAGRKYPKSPEDAAEIIAIARTDKEMEIRSMLDRLAVVRFRLEDALSIRLGNATNLFRRSETNYFENRVIISLKNQDR